MKQWEQKQKEAETVEISLPSAVEMIPELPKETPKLKPTSALNKSYRAVRTFCVQDSSVDIEAGSVFVASSMSANALQDAINNGFVVEI